MNHVLIAAVAAREEESQARNTTKTGLVLPIYLPMHSTTTRTRFAKLLT